jgi:hypothetical protein
MIFIILNANARAGPQIYGVHSKRRVIAKVPRTREPFCSFIHTYTAAHVGATQRAE